MKPLFRLLGGLIAVLLILVTATLTVKFIKNVWFGSGPGSRGHVAVLDVSGIITSSDSFLEKLREKLKDRGVKALVVRVNSPGGMVGPSQEIYEALKKADEKIPVVISMQAVAASGGYYISLGGRKVYSNPGTLTASIGVIMEFFNFEKLAQWAKVERFSLTAGKLKDAGSPFRAMTPEERAFFKVLLDDVHQQFRTAVQTRRKLTPQALDQIADGRVLTGKQAFDAKLVDALGTSEDAIAFAKQVAKLDADSTVDYPEKDTSPLRRLLFGSETDSLFRGVLNALSGEHTAPVLSSPGWSVMLLAPVRG